MIANLPRNHEFVNSDPTKFDSNCLVCEGKDRDAIHHKQIVMTPNEILDKLSRIQGHLTKRRDKQINIERVPFDWLDYDDALIEVAQCRDDHRPEQETT